MPKKAARAELAPAASKGHILLRPIEKKYTDAHNQKFWDASSRGVRANQMKVKLKAAKMAKKSAPTLDPKFLMAKTSSRIEARFSITATKLP